MICVYDDRPKPEILLLTKDVVGAAIDREDTEMVLSE